MKAFLFGMAASLLVAAPAAAVEVVGTSAGLDNGVSVFNAGIGILQVDYLIGRPGPIALDLLVESGDEGGIRFNSTILVDTGIVLGRNLKGLTLTLEGGPVFSLIGDVVADFSEAVVSGAPGTSVVGVTFLPVGEGAGVLLGNVFGGPDGDFVISVAGLNAGDRFRLILSGAVPEASTWAMLIAGFGLVGRAMRRRRATVAA